jgi:hypothetical protein
MSGGISLPSDRSFGLTFVAVFGLVAVWLIWTGRPGGLAFVSLSVATLAVTLVRASLLRPLNRVWMKLGALLHTIVSPIVLGAIYYVVIAPVGITMRLFGRDALNRRFVPAQRSYWIDREPPGPAPESLKDQF